MTNGGGKKLVVNLIFVNECCKEKSVIIIFSCVNLNYISMSPHSTYPFLSDPFTGSGVPHMSPHIETMSHTLIVSSFRTFFKNMFFKYLTLIQDCEESREDYYQGDVFNANKTLHTWVNAG